MEMIGERRGELIEMNARGSYTHVVFSIPARGLIGLRTKLLNATQGTAIMHHRFDRYRARRGQDPQASQWRPGLVGYEQGSGLRSGIRCNSALKCSWLPATRSMRV